MAENRLADLSMNFAVAILKLTESTKGHYSICNQLERSATSIGANIREAKYAHSKPDFIAKLQIALKECYGIDSAQITYPCQLGHIQPLCFPKVATAAFFFCSNVL